MGVCFDFKTDSNDDNELQGSVVMRDKTELSVIKKCPSYGGILILRACQDVTPKTFHRFRLSQWAA